MFDGGGSIRSDGQPVRSIRSTFTHSQSLWPIIAIIGAIFERTHAANIVSINKALIILLKAACLAFIEFSNILPLLSSSAFTLPELAKFEALVSLAPSHTSSGPFSATGASNEGMRARF